MQNQKAALVTGATSGIGFHTAGALARVGHIVYITGRDSERGRTAELELREAAGHQNVHFIQADASTVAGNEALAAQILAATPGLDVLVNNVGAAYNDRVVSRDGYEATLGTNFVGPFALTEALLPILRRSGDARIVNVASAAHAMWNGDPFDDIHGDRHFLGSAAYARSKFLNVAWTFALARRLDGTRAATIAVDPGTAWTPMTQSIAPRSMPLWLRALWPLVRWMQWSGTAENAARSSIFAATAADGARLNGAYIDKGGRPGLRPERLVNEALQERVYELGSTLAANALTRRAASAMAS